MTSSELVDILSLESAAHLSSSPTLPPLLGEHDGAGLQVAVVCSRYNGTVTERLLTGALDALRGVGCVMDDVIVTWVPGAFELPLATRSLILSKGLDAAVCLAAVIKGETDHYYYVASQCAEGISRVQLDTGVPIGFGVLTTDNLEQALARAGSGSDNKGFDAALAAVEMATLLKQVGRGGNLSEKAVR